MFLISREAKAAKKKKQNDSLCSVREKGMWMFELFPQAGGLVIAFFYLLFFKTVVNIGGEEKNEK